MGRPASATRSDRLIELARAQIGGTGEWSLATDREWLDRMFSEPGVTARLWEGPGGELRGAASIRVDDRTGSPVTVTSLLRPGSEDVWIGQSAWIEAVLGSTGPSVDLKIVTEAMTDAEVGRWRALSFDLVFEEIAMERDLAGAVASAPWPPGATVLDWSPETAVASFAVYEAAFQDRPGFPAWTRSEWLERLTAGDDFLAAASCCALVDDVPAGFVVCDRGWVDQVGVVPGYRRRGLASALVTEALARMRSLGFPSARLRVNANNPAALAAWVSLGWREVGRRGRFERMANERPDPTSSVWLTRTAVPGDVELDPK